MLLRRGFAISTVLYVKVIEIFINFCLWDSYDMGDRFLVLHVAQVPQKLLFKNLR
jgi:hypothetical protein